MQFLRTRYSHVHKAGQDMLAAAIHAVFVIQAPGQVCTNWQRVTEMLRKQVPPAAPIMVTARDGVLAFLHILQE